VTTDESIAAWLCRLNEHAVVIGQPCPLCGVVRRESAIEGDERMLRRLQALGAAWRDAADAA